MLTWNSQSFLISASADARKHRGKARPFHEEAGRKEEQRLVMDADGFQRSSRRGRTCLQLRARRRSIRPEEELRRRAGAPLPGPWDG